MNSPVRAFLFERAGKRVVAYWHIFGTCQFELAGGAGTLTAGDRAYYTTDFSADAVRAAFAGARLLP